MLCKNCHKKLKRGIIVEETNWNKFSDETYKFVQTDPTANPYKWSSNNQGKDNTTATSTFKIITKANGVCTFDWSVSSESRYDKLTITVDDITKVRDASGTNSGTVNVDFTPGTHTIVATYAKDSSTSRFDDTATITLYPFREQISGWVLDEQ